MLIIYVKTLRHLTGSSELLFQQQFESILSICTYLWITLKRSLYIDGGFPGNRG
jgi:hypothetical protein